MLSASKKIDYGILLMACLPEKGSHEFRSLQDIAEEKQLSAGFLSQVVSCLKKAGLVVAREGLKGGYQLSKLSTKITLSEIIEAIEGPISLTNCQNPAKGCQCEQTCPTKGMWNELQGVMNNYLEQKTLDEFRKSHHPVSSPLISL